MLGSPDKGFLHFALLGPPQVYRDGQVLAFPSHKALALLLYLALEEGQHARKTLSELFWPESDAAHARAALRTTVLELRDVLTKEASPEARVGPDRIPHLHVDRDTLSLDLTSGISLDLQGVQVAWMLARDTARSSTTLPEETRRAYLAHLQEAARLSRGEFLANFSLHNAPGFDDWARFQREYWHLRLQLVFDRLSQWYEEIGETDQAIATIIRWLSFSLLNEDASQRLMRLHFATGNRVAALQAYEALRAILASEIHAEPTPETMALAERIRTTTPLHQMTPQTPGIASLLHEAPLVGRTREYGILLQCYHAARQGQAQVVLVEGEAGSGKTRLATEFLDWAVTQKADVLRGQAFESSRRLSYQPIIDALRPRIEQENAPEDLLHDVWLAEIARLLPELRERYPDLSGPAADASVARNHLFEAVARLLEALAARPPLLLFLDDLHWADSATLDLLHYLARSITEHATPVFLLLTVRTEALQITPRLAEWRATLGRIVPLTRLQLGPLTAQDTLHLLQAMISGDQRSEATGAHASVLGTSLPTASLERVGRRLFAETGGHPFFLIETLKLLLAHTAIPPQSGGNGTRNEDLATALIKELSVARLFPPGVRELVSLQLDRLSSPAFAFLVAGAVLEQEARFEWICQVADLSEHEGLVALDEVLRNRLIREPPRQSNRSGSSIYTFTHDMIREIVSVEASEARSRIFHRRALSLLQEASVSPAKLAYHALAAGLSEPAFHLSIAAGDEARTVFALDDAIEHYEQAWHLLTRQPTRLTRAGQFSASEVHHLSISLGRVYALTRTWEQGRPLYGNMLRQVLRMAAQENDTLELALTQWYQTMIDLYTANLSTATTHGERAVALARSIGKPDVIIQSLDALAFITMQLGAWKENEQWATEVHTLYAALQDRAMEADSLCMLANACLHRGQLQMGIRHARSALTISRQTKNVWGQVNALYDLGTGLCDSGAYTEALALALQAVANARTLSTHSARANTLLLRALIQLGSIYRALQTVDAARAIDLEALRLNETSESHSYTTVVTTVLCADYALAAEWDDAHHYARQAATVADDQGISYAELPHWSVTKALLHAGDVVQTREHLRRLDARSGDGLRDRVQYLRACAELARWEGQHALARSSLEEACVLAEEIGLAEERWQLPVVLADLYQAQGEQVLAAQAYTRAATVVQELASKVVDEAMRTGFLAAPQVRHVLEHSGIH
ncbi:MAG: AAA family ATPase [Chloroflexota bacterium]|nr:AAA family ATPase [Chloroflexota bacterium]